VFGGIGSTKTGDNGSVRMWHDPHVIYEQTSKGELLSLHAGNTLDAADAAAS